MKIGYVDYSLVRPVTGIGKVTQNFRRETALMANYVCIEPWQFDYDCVPGYINKIIFKIWYLFILPLNCFFKGVDVYLEFNMIKPFFIRKVVYFVHDLAFNKNKKHRKEKSSRIRDRFLGELAKSKLVLVNSNSTKVDVIDFVGSERCKVDVCHLGTGLSEVDQKNGDVILEKLNLKKSDVIYLFVGTVEPRKNIDELVFCFKEKWKEGRKLVIAGGVGWNSDATVSIINRFNKSIDGSILLTGYVSDSELCALYERSDFFVYPCKDEGFGIPLVEALCFKKQILAFNSEVTQEVVGDAAHLYEHSSYFFDDIEKIGAIDLKVIESQSEKFSWSNFSNDVTQSINGHFNGR